MLTEIFYLIASPMGKSRWGVILVGKCGLSGLITACKESAGHQSNK